MTWHEEENPGRVKGISYRSDRNPWEATYKVDGHRVRKSFIDRNEAIRWLDVARRLRLKEGAGILPTTASEPLLTHAEKAARVQANLNAVTVPELCNDLKDYIAAHPTQYKDQVNPPRRLDRIKAGLGDRIASGLKPREVEAWLDCLTNRHT